MKCSQNKVGKAAPAESRPGLGFFGKIILTCSCMVATLVLVMATVVGYAYYSKKEVYNGFLGMEIELLFEQFDDATLAEYQAYLKASDSTVTDTESTEWGTRMNPYIISNAKHLFNLSELQRLGYFHNNFIADNYDETGAYTRGGNPSMPYFLVCDPRSGKPVAVDGTDSPAITSIGTGEYPFIGSVKGAFVVGEYNGQVITADKVVYGTPTAEQTAAGMVAEADITRYACSIGNTGHSSDTSALYNVTVNSDTSSLDCGLFGAISYLGTEPEPGTDGSVQQFAGAGSEMSDLLLYDVQVQITDATWDEKLIAFFEKHLFNFTDAPDPDKTFHEDHHVGIAIGHIAYSKLERISVFYSSEQMVAIDLADASTNGKTGNAANYSSAAGILGFIDNINPVYANGMLTAGSGVSNDDLGLSDAGGGGMLSGTEKGYVIAQRIYETYNLNADGNTSPFTRPEGSLEGSRYLVELYGNVPATNDDGTVKTDEQGKTVYELRRLCSESDGKYYFYDGVFTFALSKTPAGGTVPTDSIVPTWWEWRNVKNENGENVLDEDGNPIREAVASEQADQFSIGVDDASQWIVNTSKGNKAVVAYVKRVESNNELKIAIDDGKKLFIMQEDGNLVDLFAMTLFSGSQANENATDIENKFFTGGTALKFGDATFIDSLVQSYNGGEWGLPEDMTSEYIGVDAAVNRTELLTAALGDGSLKAINVGITTDTGSVDIAKLRAEYKIEANVLNSYTFYVTDTDQLVTLNAGKFEDYYDYDDSGYDGYFYYTVEPRQTLFWTTDYYHYFWQPLDPSLPTVRLTGENGSTSAPDSYLRGMTETVDNQTQNVTWEGERVYQTRSGTSYTGVVVNINESEFYSGSSANAQGVNLTKPSGTMFNYFYKDVGSTAWKYSDGTTMTGGTFDETETQLASGLKEYSYTSGNQTYIGVQLDRYPNYTLSGYNEKDTTADKSNTNFLRMFNLHYSRLWFNFGNHYVMWAGRNGDVAASLFAHDFLGNITPEIVGSSTAATIRFDNGYCYIQYNVGNTVNYLSTDGTKFNAAPNTGATTKLSIYTVEGTQDMNYGRVTFDPAPQVDAEGNIVKDADGNPVSTGQTFSADTHVLYAGTSQGTTADNDTYTVVDIADLGWGNKEGAPLTAADLQKKFHMQDGIEFGISINLFGNNYNSDGLLRAPVGSKGDQANIPQSCIAFMMNEENPENEIRVIVAVPVSEFYYGEKSGENDTTTDAYKPGDYQTYFNMWKLGEASSGFLQTFNPTNTADRFLLPSSHPYEPGVVPVNRLGEDGTANAAYGVGTEYIYAKMQARDENGAALFDENGAPAGEDTTYRCYLNGDRVLVAYTFKAPDSGIYVLGAVGYKNDDTSVSVPMEIVYFSADGVASPGRDGSGGSRMGTVDFVYANEANTDIVTVKDVTGDSSENNGAVTEDYNAYYPSYVLLRFDNKLQKDGAFVSINNEKIVIRRWVATAADAAANGIRSTMTYTISYGGASEGEPAETASKYVKVNATGNYHDVLDGTYNKKE